MTKQALVLRLLEEYPFHRVPHAIEKALELRRCSRDIAAQCLYSDELPLAPTLILDGHERLQGIRPDVPDLDVYAALLDGAGSNPARKVELMDPKVP